MIRKAMWGLAAAAAVLLAIYTVIGFPTANRGTEATIGAAQRYQAPQLAAGDVVLGDASAQQFLQSEAFDRLLKDPQARAILSDNRLLSQIRNPEFTDAIRAQEVRGQLSSDLLSRLFDDNAALAAFNRALGQGLSAAAAVHRLADNAELSADVRSLFTQLEANAVLVRMLDENAIRVAFSDNAFRNLLRQAGVMAFLDSAQFDAAIRHAGFDAAVRSPSFLNQLSAQ